MISFAHSALGRSRTVSTALLLGVAGLLAVTLVEAAGSRWLAADFRVSYLEAAQAVREGASPYPDGDSFPYLYPPLLAELLVPLTLLPGAVASFIGLVASVAAVMGALAVVGVRDVRCFAAVAIWAPAWNAFETANITAGLCLLAALVWRYRDEMWKSAGALGIALALKFILGSLLVWTAATRRVGTAAVAGAIALVLALASWAAIGFAGLTSYADQLREIEFSESYSLVGIATSLGFDPIVGRVAMILGGAALLAAVGVLSRRGDEVRAFTCAIVAALVLTPVVWLHYLVFMAVPLGISRPSFAAVWLLPIVLWVCPRGGHGEGVQPYLPAVVVGLLFVMLMKSPSEATRPSEVLT